MPNIALKIQSPILDSTCRVAKCSKGNPELRRPSDFRNVSLDLPHTVPVQIEPTASPSLLLTPRTADEPSPPVASPTSLICDLTVVLDTRGVCPENEPVLPVQESVKNDLKAVSVPELRISMTI